MTSTIVYARAIKKLAECINPNTPIYVKTIKEGQTSYKCCKCSKMEKESNRTFNVVRHYGRFHVSKKNKFNCRCCDMSFDTKAEYLNHINIHGSLKKKSLGSEEKENLHLTCPSERNSRNNDYQKRPIVRNKHPQNKRYKLHKYNSITKNLLNDSTMSDNPLQKKERQIGVNDIVMSDNFHQQQNRQIKINDIVTSYAHFRQKVLKIVKKSNQHNLGYINTSILLKAAKFVEEVKQADLSIIS